MHSKSSTHIDVTIQRVGRQNEDEFLESTLEMITAPPPYHWRRECIRNLQRSYLPPNFTALKNVTFSQNSIQEKEMKEYLFKILVIGELATGKTSFIKRYVHQYFSSQYRATIGVDFALKVINWDDSAVVRLQLWDIAGQERFGNMTRVYYKEAVGAFVVFDVSRPQTFNCVTKWKSDLDAKVLLADGNSIPCVLLANKADLPKEGKAADEGYLNEFCRENQFVGWYYTSPKENTNVEDAARFLVSKILESQKSLSLVESDSQILFLDDNIADLQRKGCC